MKEKDGCKGFFGTAVSVCMVWHLLVNIPPPCFASMRVNRQNDYVVETSLVGTVMNGLSHLHGCKYHDQFIINLIRGLGGNLNMKSRLEFTKEVRNFFQALFSHNP
jgi:hypothetical protein